jgi:hypothetical protein
MNLRFTQKYVHQVPDAPGIFCLWHHANLVYVGRTAPRSTLREELRHALTVAMAGDMSATHFSFEETRTPQTRAAEELRDYFERWGSLPRYNESAPSHHEGALSRAERHA